MCHCSWSLDGKLKVLGHRFRPALPCLGSMGTMETGVDLGAQELSRVSLQMSTVCREFRSELLRNIPARTSYPHIQCKSPSFKTGSKIMLTKPAASQARYRVGAEAGEPLRRSGHCTPSSSRQVLLTAGSPVGYSTMPMNSATNFAGCYGKAQ